MPASYVAAMAYLGIDAEVAHRLVVDLRRLAAGLEHIEAVVADGSRWWRVDFSRGGRRITARFNG